MQLKNVIGLAKRLNRPITILDTETTGLGAAEATGIVDIAYLTIHPDGRVVEFETLINPSQAIQEGASRIHGIWPKDVKDAPRFKDVAGSLIEPFHPDSNHVISGFNSKSYDTPIIIARLSECFSSVQSLDNVVHLDVRMVYTGGQRYKKGKLFEVAAEYGVEVDLAHRAMADVKTTALVLESMIERHGVDHVLNEARYPGHGAPKQQAYSSPAHSSGKLPSVPRPSKPASAPDLFSAPPPRGMVRSAFDEPEPEVEPVNSGFEGNPSFRARKAILLRIKADPNVVFDDRVIDQMADADRALHGSACFSSGSVHLALSEMMKIKQVKPKHVRNDEIVDRVLPILKEAFDRVPPQKRLVKDGTPRLSPLLYQVERLCGFEVGFNQLIVAMSEMPVPLEDMDSQMHGGVSVPGHRLAAGNDSVR